MQRYAPHASSPAMPLRGIELAIAPQIQLQHRPALPAHGAFRIAETEIALLSVPVHAAIAVIVRGGVEASFVVGEAGLTFDDDAHADQGFVQGYFNLELFEELGATPAPMQLWVNAALLGFRSEVLHVEVLP